jgi:hypothetical protein
MPDKLTGFLRDFGLSLFMIALGFGMLYMTSSSLHIICERQGDETYMCAAGDEIFGWSPVKTQANHVTGMDWELKCKNTNQGRCAYVPQFLTTTGEKVKVSSLFTGNREKVQELVQTVDSRMKEKSPTIDHTGTRSMLLSGSIFFCLAPILLLLPFLKLRTNTQEKGPKTLISLGTRDKES